MKTDVMPNGLEKYIAFMIIKNLPDKLPDKRCFYDSLKDQHISNKYYLTCNKIWNKFSMKNMGDYHHYSKKDVLLLVYVFENLLTRV